MNVLTNTTAADEPMWAGFSRRPEDKAAGPSSARPTDRLNILVPTDFSDASALDCALRMAAHHRAHITLLHAVHLNLAPHGPANLAEQKTALCQEALAKAGPFLAAAQDLGATAACLLEEGPPSKVISAAARRCQPDLIILSDRKRGWLARWLGRGTVERTLRAAFCPVLVLPA